MKAGVAHPAVYTHPMIGTFPHVNIIDSYITLLSKYHLLKSMSYIISLICSQI